MKFGFSIHESREKVREMVAVRELEEASTHKSAKTHAGNVFVTLTF